MLSLDLCYAIQEDAKEKTLREITERYKLGYKQHMNHMDIQFKDCIDKDGNIYWCACTHDAIFNIVLDLEYKGLYLKLIQTIETAGVDL